jgi:hypothetical protein
MLSDSREVLEPVEVRSPPPFSYFCRGAPEGGRNRRARTRGRVDLGMQIWDGRSQIAKTANVVPLPAARAAAREPPSSESLSIETPYSGAATASHRRDGVRGGAAMAVQRQDGVGGGAPTPAQQRVGGGR